MLRSLVGSEMCIRDRYQRRVRGFGVGSMTIKVTIKWGKEKFSDFEIDLDAGIPALRENIFNLTRVPIEAQKIFPKKGKVLKDDSDLSSFGLKDGSTVSLMGSATEQVATTVQADQELREGQKFVENMKDDELAKINQVYPTGLENLQNTCYLNACLQNLRNIPEIMEALQTFTPAQGADATNQQFVVALRALFEQMSAGGDAVTPYMFVSLFRRMFPQFAQMQTVGQGQQIYMQQDADEAWGTLNRVFQTTITGPEYEGNNLYDHLFGGEMQTELSCIENPDETNISSEPFWKLSCYMDKEVTFVTAGVMKGMEGTMEMTSRTLGVPANFMKTSRISKMPRYLVIGFNRFDSKTIKQTGPGDSDKVVGLKILKPVAFPFVLDIYQLCCADQKSVLDVERRKLEDIKEAELAARQATGTLLEQRACDLSPEEAAAELERLKAEKMGTAAPSEAEGAAAEAMDVAEPAPAEGNTTAMEEDRSASVPLGYYDCVGVVTHKGRALSSGHYQGFVKNEKGSEGEWLPVSYTHLTLPTKRIV
eukprot:TRINITY_DN17278_c0_g1_i12.p1 TRINITY_DN17278_c0_g1~~TRINITY_DN17278_c0_g1_i12.p1  ORF type:complete len:537 (-),score=158.08 TRINITY_DN17278_c0_g1_i12:95-1705(-)